MHVYKFRKAAGSQCALTLGSTGAALPNDGNPWIYEKTVDLDVDDEPRIGASSLEIMAGIDAAGYFLWPNDELNDPAAKALGKKGGSYTAKILN